MSDLVQRLRQFAKQDADYIPKGESINTQAADRIEQLERENAELREALEGALSELESHEAHPYCGLRTTFDEVLEQARAALANKGEK